MLLHSHDQPTETSIRQSVRTVSSMRNDGAYHGDCCRDEARE